MKHEEIESVVDDLVGMRRKYLTERGWKPTSDTPGAYWMWRKNIAGKEYTTFNESEAINLQRGAYSYGWETDPFPDGEECNE